MGDLQRPVTPPTGNPDPVLSANVQGDILFGGIAKFHQTFAIFKITNPKGFCKILRAFTTHHIDSAADTFNKRQQLQSRSPGEILDMVSANIAFSANGLTKLAEASKTLSGDGNLILEPEGSTGPFARGMLNDASALGDPALTLGSNASAEESEWHDAMSNPLNVHGILLVGGSSQTLVDEKVTKMFAALRGYAREIAHVDGKVRPAELRGHEHFGFEDGVSQPNVRGLDTPAGENPETTPQGVFLCGRDGDNSDKLEGGTPNKRPDWTRDGSFLVVRRLEQDVAKFDQFLTLNCAAVGLSERPDKLGARLIGRWKSGCPIDVAPDHDNPTIGNDASKNNNFEFGTAVEPKVFPHACHIRKAYPRDDLKTFDNTDLDVERSRILRRGIPYGLEVDADPDGKRGLMFLCYQSSLTQGFKRIQEAWVNTPSFISPAVDANNPQTGLDPIIGQQPNATPAEVSISGLDPLNEQSQLDTTKNGINQFVIHRGGEYFFSPSISALKHLIPPLKS